MQKCERLYLDLSNGFLSDFLYCKTTSHTFYRSILWYEEDIFLVTDTISIRPKFDEISFQLGFSIIQ